MGDGAAATLLCLCVGKYGGGSSFFGKLRRFPVAQPLGFRDALAQHDGRKLAQALLFDAPVGGQLLQVDEAAGPEAAQGQQRADVARHVGADFQNRLVLQQFDELLLEAHPIEAEQIAAPRCGELQQGDAVGDARLERGTRLGVEAQHRRRRQVAAGGFDLLLVVDDDDRAVEEHGRQLCGIFVRYVLLKRSFFHANSLRRRKVTD